MTGKLSIDIPKLEGLSISVSAETVTFAGTIAVPDPRAVLGHFFRSLHEAVLTDGVKELDVDVRKLTFVNSSAIRLFVDWASWIRATDSEHRYLLRFLTDKRITWQRTSFAVLQTLAQDALTIVAE